jgi:hypothetical protein
MTATTAADAASVDSLHYAKRVQYAVCRVLVLHHLLMSNTVVAVVCSCKRM